MATNEPIELSDEQFEDLLRNLKKPVKVLESSIVVSVSDIDVNIK